MKAAAGPGLERAERIKARIGGVLKRRFFLRFHISLILVFTFCAGLVTTRALLWLGVDTMWLRYFVAMLVAYAAFLVGVRLWLAYVGAADLPDVIAPARASASRDRKGQGGNGGGFDLPFNLGGNGSSGTAPLNLPFRSGGGGNFAGGGASDSFVSAEGAGDLLPSSGGSGGASGTGSGFSFDLGDGDGLVVLLLALLVLLAVVGSAFWIVWIGPEILVEAAFEALLAGGLVKSLHAGGTGGWIGRVLRKTLLPFMLVSGAAVAFAAVGQSAYPGARTFREVIRAAWLGEEAAGEVLARRETDPDIARVDEDLYRLGAIEKLVKPEERARAAAAFARKGELLARRDRHEEMEAAYDRAAGLVQAGDPPDMQHAAADATRLKAYALGEAGKVEAALAAYGVLQERINGSGDVQLQWRSAWATLQQAVLMEAREEGSGEALLADMLRRFGNSTSQDVRSQVSDGYYTLGMISLWRAKKDGGARLATTLAEAIARFESAHAAAAPESANLAQAWSGIAYGRFLSGDRNGAALALTQIPLKERTWVLASVIPTYVDNRTLPVDADFRTLGEQQLKAANG